MFWRECILFLLLGQKALSQLPKCGFYPVVIVAENSCHSVLAGTSTVMVKAGILQRREKQFSFSSLSALDNMLFFSCAVTAAELC